jgi:RES domain-containing protein
MLRSYAGRWNSKGVRVVYLGASLDDAWAADNSSLILQVPSATVAGEYHYLVNPQHPDFIKIVYSEKMPFNYDPRLLK